MRLSVFTEFVFHCSGPSAALLSCVRQRQCFCLKERERESAWSWSKKQFEPSFLYMLLKIKACHPFQLHYIIRLHRWSLLACCFVWFFFCESFIIQLRLNLRTPRQPLLHFWNYKITILDLQTERVHFHLRPVALGTALCLINVNITEFAINQAHLFLFEHFILGCWQCAIFFLSIAEHLTCNFTHYIWNTCTLRIVMELLQVYIFREVNPQIPALNTTI